MITVKKLLKSLFVTIVVFIFLSFVFSLICYYNLLNYKFAGIFKLVIPILSVFFGGVNIGKNSIKKGWLFGVKHSLVVIGLLLIITLFLKNFKYEYLIYLLILLSSGVLGSMIGINKK